jgi:hypothetical protein
MPNGEKRPAAAGPKPKDAVPEVWKDPLGALGKAALEDIGKVGQLGEDIWSPPSLNQPGPPLPPEYLPTGELKPPTEEEIAKKEIERELTEKTERAGIDFGGFPNLVTVPAGYNATAAAAYAPETLGTQTTSRTRSAATPEQLDELARAYDYEARAASAQLDAQAAGMGLQMDAYNDLHLAQQKDIFPILQQAQTIFDDANRQLLGIQDMMDDVRANRINPGQFFANIGDAGTFAAAMAVAAGHLASAMGGGPNVALSVINGAIDRNLRAQELNQAHDRAVLQAEIMIFDRMRTLGVDRLNQANVYNALLLSLAQSSIEAINAATSSVALRAQSGIVQAQLAQKKMDYLIRAAGTISAQTTMKIQGLSQAAKAGITTTGFDTAQAIIQQYKSGLPAGAPGNPEEMASMVRAGLATFGQTLNPDEQRALLMAHFPAGFESNLLTPIEEGKAIKVLDSETGETRSYIPTAAFENYVTKAEKPKAIKQFIGERHLLESWKKLEQLAEKAKATSGVKPGWLGQLVWTREGGWDIKGTKNVPRDAYTVQTLLNDITVQTMIAASGRVEAIRGAGEMPILQLRAKVPSDTQTLISVITGSKWEDQIKPALDQSIINHKATWTPWLSGVDR